MFTHSFSKMTSKEEENAFCGTKFWDNDVTWYTQEPDFTPCFHKTVISWTPTLIFLIFALEEGRKYRKSQNRKIPWTFLNLLKVCLTVLLIVLSVVEFVFTIITDQDDDEMTQIFPVDYVTNWVFILTYSG